LGKGYEGGEFEWSGMTQDAMKKLSDRYNYLMENPRGTTDAERQAIINFATERIKRGERGQMQSMTDRLSRTGMAGSGFEESEARAIQRGTREDVASLQRQVAMDELDRRFTELMGGTQMGQSLLGTMMTGDQTAETLTSDRRDQWLNELLGKISAGGDIAQTAMQGDQIPELLTSARRGQWLDELLGKAGATQGMIGTAMLGEQTPEVLSMARQNQWLDELLGKGGLDLDKLRLLMTGEQTSEALSSARRGEGTTAMQQYLAYMNMIMGGYNQGSSWLQSILG